MKSAIITIMLCALAQQPRVAFLGDSHMQALGPLMSSGLRERGYRPVGIVARPGWSLRRYQLANDVTVSLRPMRPDVVVIVLGSNGYAVRSERRYRPRARWLVNAVRRAGARRIVWIGPGSVDDEDEELVDVAATHQRAAELQMSILPTMGVDWLDSRDITRGHLRYDGYHYTLQGYHIWADWAMEQMEVCGD